MSGLSDRALEFSGRTFSGADVELIREVVGTYSRLTRHELAQTVCELLSWQRPNGGAKWRECLDLLSKLEGLGEIEQPELRQTKRRGTLTVVPRSSRGEWGEAVVGSVRDLAPIQLSVVTADQDRLLWRELVGRYHYLGFKVPFGAQLRYLIRADGGRVLGCMQMSSPAWRVAPRDEWIGWDDTRRGLGLQRIVNNSRYLILPWVTVKNLASHVLSLLERRVAADWQSAYGIEPVLLETFVDSGRFRGTCYRASNWIRLGATQGRGRMDRDHSRVGAEPKDVYVRPLVKKARRCLQEGS